MEARYVSVEMLEEMRREYASLSAGLSALTAQVGELRQSMRYVEQMLGEVRTAGKEMAIAERLKLAADATLEARVKALEDAEDARRGRLAVLWAAVIGQMVAIAALGLPRLLAALQ